MRKISEILCCVAILCCALSACSDKPATVKVSSFNIWLNTLGERFTVDDDVYAGEPLTLAIHGHGYVMPCTSFSYVLLRLREDKGFNASAPSCSVCCFFMLFSPQICILRKLGISHRIQASNISNS